MAKKNIFNEICDAITEIKKILASPDVKNELLRKTLGDRLLELLNELYEAHIKGTSRSKKTRTKKTNTMKEERHERKTNTAVSSAESSK